ncbi:hypothetical protein [Nocardia sp. CC227C]|uniref:hypothetical protein n=1 Tax=Nocardia sp. CC227C TaxID=3044562 RepID=UPI00278BD9B3|nr:hypothetical protein [Nocardia sp. CC227C]
MKRAALTLLGILVIGILVAGFSGRAAAAPVSAGSVEAPAAIGVTIDETGEPVAMCMMPGDSIGTRAAIGAVIGFFLGLPVFIIGSIPIALAGAAFGALSYVLARWSADQIPGPC